MPVYKFKCQSCNNVQDEYLTIKEYNDSCRLIECLICKKVDLQRYFGDVHGVIERKKEDILNNIKEDISKTIDKIRSGDESTINDIYGERVNPHKRRTF